MASKTQPNQHPLDYTACLVPMWQDEDRPWRASAQSGQDRHVMRLADLKALFALLNAQTEDSQNMGSETSTLSRAPPDQHAQE